MSSFNWASTSPSCCWSSDLAGGTSFKSQGTTGDVIELGLYKLQMSRTTGDSAIVLLSNNNQGTGSFHFRVG